MSSTNRAFIKAYRQDSADASPAAGNAPTMQNQAAATKRDAAHVSTSVRDAAYSSFEPQPVSGKRPLSSFINREQGALERTDSPSPRPSPIGRGGTAAETQNANFLQPGTIVASLQWPRVCRTLGLQSGPQLDRLVDLLRAQASAGHSLIGIMGLFPRVGTTTTAMCLAARAARRVRRAMLVDGNFCHPRIAAWVDAVPTVGWEEVLRHSSPLADAVIRATDDNLDLLAIGPKASKDPETLAAGLQAAVTAGVLRHAYDLALIDVGTFFDPKSQPVVLELVRNMGIDTVVAVTGPDSADARDLATIHEYLEPIGCQLLGTIENRVAKPQVV
jgi:Mrp family chromosome partitioning ATPase